MQILVLLFPKTHELLDEPVVVEETTIHSHKRLANIKHTLEVAKPLELWCINTTKAIVVEKNMAL